MTENEIKNQFEKIANAHIPYERAYLDISDEFADAVFDLYDAADVYMYLTNKERKDAYRDMKGFGARSKQIQYEWMKKAIWRIADKKAWNELECWDEDDEDDDLEESKMSEISEAKSKWLASVDRANKSANELYDYRNQLVGAVGSGEMENIITGALKAATTYMRAAYDLLLQVDDSVSESDAVKRVIGNLLVAAGKVKILESKDTTGIYVDPYAAEYLPAEMLSEMNETHMVEESIREDADLLPDDIDDDPDALMGLDAEGMPVKFNNAQVDLDPFAVRLFRNNAELVDPPEVFDATVNAEVSTEPEIEPGNAQPTEVDQAASDEFIDTVADGLEKKDPADSDFDVFGTAPVESKMPVSSVIPKVNENGMPPQFKKNSTQMANENIAVDPGNNLKMLSYLLGSGI